MIRGMAAINVEKTKGTGPILFGTAYDVTTVIFDEL